MDILLEIARRIDAQFVVIFTLIACNFIAFGLMLRAGTRLARLETALVDLDWEALANLVGDVSTLKRTIQKLNMRLNGMETSDPVAALNKLPNLAGNVQAIGQTRQSGG